MKLVLSSGIKEFPYKLCSDEVDFVKTHLTNAEKYEGCTWEDRVLYLLTKVLDCYPLNEIQRVKAAWYFHISDHPVTWLGKKRIWPELRGFVVDYFERRETIETPKA